MIEGVGHRGQDLKDSHGSAVVPQGSDENGAGAEPAAAGKVDAGIGFCVVAEQNLTGAYALSGESGIGLKPDAQVWSGTPSARAADDFTSGVQGDSGTGGASQSLGTLGDDVDARLKVEFARLDVEVSFRGVEFERIRTGKSDGAEVVTTGVHWDRGCGLLFGKYRNVGHRAEKVAHQLIEFGIHDEVGGFSPLQRPA
jgi:hypothetical protein